MEGSAGMVEKNSSSMLKNIQKRTCDNHHPHFLLKRREKKPNWTKYHYHKTNLLKIYDIYTTKSLHYINIIFLLCLLIMVFSWQRFLKGKLLVSSADGHQLMYYNSGGIYSSFWHHGVQWPINKKTKKTKNPDKLLLFVQSLMLKLIHIH